MGTTKRLALSSTDTTRSDDTTIWNHFAPATHGMLLLDVTFENNCIINAEPILGSMHRGAEKLFESRDYRQILGLANRHEWLSAFSGEVGVASLIERELGLDVPTSAKWLRTLLLEVFRITSHLAFLAGYPWHAPEISAQIRQSRESLVLHIRSYTGSRMHPMLTQIGGLTHAPTTSWLLELAELTKLVATQLQSMNELMVMELANTTNVGVLSADAVNRFAISGPVARASGVAIDCRTSTPHFMYSQLSTFKSVTQTTGDIPARMQQLCDEIAISSKMVTEITTESGKHITTDVNVLIPKVLRVPEGEFSFRLETPLGMASWLLISKGDKYPYRLALRPASLHTVLALGTVLCGHTESDIPKIVASMPFITGDADR